MMLSVVVLFQVKVKRKNIQKSLTERLTDTELMSMTVCIGEIFKTQRLKIQQVIVAPTLNWYFI